MQLSKRLLMNISLCKPCEALADVGCDHAYLSIYAVENYLAKKAIAMDLRKGPLEKATINVSNSGLSGKIDLRLGDGLSALNPYEADCILISGMGGMTVCGILENGKDKLQNVKQFILQPQSDLSLVRKLLHDMKYHIDNEKMCYEDGKYYTCISAISEDNIQNEKFSNYNLNNEELYKDNEGLHKSDLNEDIFYEYGECLLKSKDETLISFLKERINKINIIKKQISETGNGNIEDSLKHINKEEELVIKALKYIGE